MNACLPPTFPLTGGVRVIISTFTQSGPYVPAPGLISLVVECFGAGGGGGSFAGGATSARSGAGGGSGGMARSALTAGQVAAGVNVTIGLGGAAGANGGVTSFGALCVANGGLPGNAYSYGGQGGPLAGQIGSVTFAGAAGANGSSQVVTGAQDFLSGGHGGAMWGGNYNGLNADVGQTVNGMPGDPNSGAGGGGGASNQATATATGGAGGSGLCIVTEYYLASAGDDCGAGASGQARVGLDWCG